VQIAQSDDNMMSLSSHELTCSKYCQVLVQHDQSSLQGGPKNLIKDCQRD